MSKVVSSAKGAQATKAVVLGNGVSNKKEEEIPLLLLPSAPETKVEEPEKGKPQAKEKVVIQEEPVMSPKSSPLDKRMSIDALMDKADRGYLLRQKYQEIREKRKMLDSFAISHDKDNAQLTLVDAKGLTISTSNPVTIGKLLTDWMNDLNNHLKRTEDEIRTELEAFN